MIFQTKKDRSAFTRSVLFEPMSFESLFFFSLSLCMQEKNVISSPSVFFFFSYLLNSIFICFFFFFLVS